MTHKLPISSSFGGKRIGIFGGSFNPPTTAHKELADFIYHELDLDHLLWMVAPHNPEKDPASLAEFNHRYQMVDLYLKDRPMMQPSDIEQRNQSSWTIDTVRLLRAQHPDDALFFIIGTDNWLNFHLWGRDFEEILLKNVSLVIMERPGYDAAIHAESSRIFADNRVSNPAELKPFGSWCIVSNPSFDVAATNIRKALKKGEKPQHLDAEIHEYIKKHGLYPPLSD